MKIFRFFLVRIFFKKPIVAVTMLVLLLLTNYIAFSTTRTIVSTSEGYSQVSRLNVPGVYIANLDPNSDIDIDSIKVKSMQDVYDRLNDTYRYGLFTDGYIVDLKNSYDIKVPLAYMNEKYAELNPFECAEGSGLTYQYSLDSETVLPVLIGRGLADEYPVGTQFGVHDPVLDREIQYKVSGILKENSAHSNLYALDSKQYYNFSIVVPINETFIKEANIPFKINGLMDLVVTDTNKREISKLADDIHKTVGIKLNFYSQQENIDFYNEYFVSSLWFLCIVTAILLAILVIVSVWSSLVAVKLMIKDFTINLLVGLSYSGVRKVFYGFYLTLTSISLTGICAVAAYYRYQSWIFKDPLFITFGFAGGLVMMDWLALLVALLVDLFLSLVIVQVLMWRIKRVPISVGVLQ
ncbi:peptide ABC transporter permease [Boudabousia tangfeifanii]|uniref:Peptide ABC transporter permease n=1 Tax=Boudabousia tangfeifanii TaxID=1912795 RepID=A0A1D9MIE8_9ACTO|nr:peptide ABC transporter permease [Boudabousia tangfeifanii]AOZ72075.1 peptide ABC transporter permease [Boudabousia tangfeifanii]